MTRINKQNFLAELGKLLTFMYEDDRQTALAMYSKLFDDAENEQGLLQLLVSPTRQAVVIARAYNARDRRLDTHSALGGSTKAESSYAKAIDKLRELAVAKGIITTLKTDQISIFDAVPEEAKSVQPEAADDEADEADEADEDAEDEGDAEEEDSEEEPVSAPPVPEKKEAASPAPVAAVNIPFVLDDEPKKETEKKVRPLLLCLYIILAVPLTVAGIAVLLIPTVLCIALAGAAGCLCFIAVSGAFGGGFAVFADMMVIIGVALMLLALAVLFLWAAIWFIGGAMVGLVGAVFSLGRKWCYKEVQAE